MSDITAKWGTTTAITITLDSLADAAARQSAAVTSHNGMGVFVRLTLLGVTGNVGDIEIYAYSALGTGNYAGAASGSDAAYTEAKWSQLEKLGTISLTNDSGTSNVVYNLAEVFGGSVPEKWGIIVRNVSGGALESAGNSAAYQTVIATQV